MERPRPRALAQILCATCELEVPWPPVRAGGRCYCCAGCAAGGPCSCSYDHDDPSEVPTMYLTSAVSAPTGVRRALPMTRACFLRLEAELNCLGPALREAEREHRQPASADVSSLAAVLAADRLRQLEHKLTSLRRVLAGVEIIEPDGVVVLGSHVAVGEVDGSQADYQIVIPGEADPVAGRISYESPMGQALLGHRAGADVTVTAPAGRRQVRIIAVE